MLSADQINFLKSLKTNIRNIKSFLHILLLNLINCLTSFFCLIFFYLIIFYLDRVFNKIM